MLFLEIKSNKELWSAIEKVADTLKDIDDSIAYEEDHLVPKAKVLSII